MFLDCFCRIPRRTNDKIPSFCVSNKIPSVLDFLGTGDTWSGLVMGCNPFPEDENSGVVGSLSVRLFGLGCTI